MGKNKLKKFAQMKEMPNVFEPTMEDVKAKSFHLRGKWNTDFFKNDNPIVLELGCGKGEYSVALARKFPNKNFIGMDIKGARMWVGASEAIDEELNNVAFVRTKIDFITSFFQENEVEEIWLTFSDPQPAKPNKRLTSKIFVDRYKQVLQPKGKINLKTDSDLLFESTEEQIKEHKYKCHSSTWDLYADLDKFPEDSHDIFKVKTHYEKLFSEKGFKIKYCQFSID